MNKFLIFLCSIFSLISSTAWALPMQGNTVVMHTNYGDNYGMYVNETQVTYNTFCLEKDQYFSNGGTYTVDSVSMAAEEGGLGAENGRDPVSDASVWLYASFFQGYLGAIADDGQRAALAVQVQNAIWFAEDEITDSSDYDVFVGTRENFDVSGWNIMAVNIISGSTDNPIDRQSQLVGETAPVPEPATMFLLGTGLVGFAGLQRRKKNN